MAQKYEEGEDTICEYLFTLSACQGTAQELW